MDATTTSLLTGSRQALRAMLRESQSEILLWVLPVLYLPAFVIGGLANTTQEPGWAMSCALVLGLSVSSALLLRQANHLLASWAVVAGCAAAGLMAAGPLRMPLALVTLGVPAGLASLVITTPAGALLAGICSALLIFTPGSLLAASLDLRLISLANLWVVFGLVWLARLPLLAAYESMHASSERSLRLLDEARDQRLQLSQALADLADANLQLTRLNRLADGLRQAADDARRAKEQFVANVSHELRTPLNMIVGFSEMILQAPEVYGPFIPPVLLADLSVIQRNSQHLSKLIDDVLDLSQIDTGKMALNKEQVLLAGLIEEAATAVRPLYQSKGLSLATELANDLPPILCDPTRIREVVLNLLSNAGRFTERGGVRVRAWQEDIQVVVSVADSGPGIAVGDAQRIFQPFEQVDASIRRRYGGTGLGLSISKGFVELHGGRMWLESKVGLGTTFYFALPIRPPPITDEGVLRWLNPDWVYLERTRQPVVGPQPDRPRFVVAEHGGALARLLSRHLPDVEVVQVAGVSEALASLADSPAQALLVNAASIGAGLQALNGGGRLPASTPAIICSLPGVSDAAAELGVSDYLVKPIAREALLGALERLAPANAEPQTILVIDDEPEALQLFWRMLLSAGRGYRVVPAGNGKQALAILREERVAAILLDLAMPDMDGFAFLEARNREPEWANIPVVITSARDPAGQPVVSGALAVTQRGGLSLAQLLGGIEALSRLLSPMAPQPAHREGPGTSPG